MISASFPEPHHSIEMHVLSTSVWFNGFMRRENEKDYIVVEIEKLLDKSFRESI